MNDLVNYSTRRLELSVRESRCGGESTYYVRRHYRFLFLVRVSFMSGSFVNVLFNRFLRGKDRRTTESTPINVWICSNELISLMFPILKFLVIRRVLSRRNFIRSSGFSIYLDVNRRTKGRRNGRYCGLLRFFLLEILFCGNFRVLATSSAQVTPCNFAFLGCSGYQCYLCAMTNDGFFILICVCFNSANDVSCFIFRFFRCQVRHLTQTAPNYGRVGWGKLF